MSAQTTETIQVPKLNREMRKRIIDLVKSREYCVVHIRFSEDNNVYLVVDSDIVVNDRESALVFYVDPFGKVYCLVVNSWHNRTVMGPVNYVKGLIKLNERLALKSLRSLSGVDVKEDPIALFIYREVLRTLTLVKAFRTVDRLLRKYAKSIPKPGHK